MIVLDWLASLDWSGFLPTLLATVVGAAIGVYGVRYGFKLQRQEAYAAAVDDAVAKVMGALSEYATSVENHVSAMRRYEKFDVGAARLAGAVLPSPPRPPSSFAASTAFGLAEITARDGEQSTMETARATWHDVRVMPEDQRKIRLIGTLSGALVEWRAGRSSLAATRDELQRISEEAEAEPPAGEEAEAS